MGMTTTTFPQHNARVSTTSGPGTVHSVWTYNDRNTVIVKMDGGKVLAFQVEEVK
jgi:hypothetical protein